MLEWCYLSRIRKMKQRQASLGFCRICRREAVTHHENNNAIDFAEGTAQRQGDEDTHAVGRGRACYCSS